jgi:hypothetical protein
VRRQVERLLRHLKAAAFTENFVGQWLGLRDIDFTEPSDVLYPEFDHLLKVSMMDPAKVAQPKKVELEKMQTSRDFLKKLRDTQEEGASLLDRTMVFFSSNLGDASTHSSKNMPVLLAGGGFKHGRHLAFDPSKPPPLCNLYVSMLQRMGIEVNKLGSSTGTLTGLETVR